MNGFRVRNYVSCAKQHCAEPAAHRFSFDYNAMTVYLSDYDGSELPFGVHLLCVGHAERFVVPRGWQLHDDRALQTPLFVPEDVRMQPRRDKDHPTVRARSGIQVRPARVGYVPTEDHPSGPLDIKDRKEAPDITRQIERLSRDLANMSSTDSQAGGQYFDWDDDSTFGDDVYVDGTGTEEIPISFLTDTGISVDGDTHIESPGGWAAR